jgi:acylphosphatase
MIRYLLIVNGRVQGVGFRFFLQLTANNLNLTGWCKNLINGNVEVEVQGLEKNVASFISTIEAGNHFSRVNHIDLSKLPVIDNERKFVIKY